MGRPAPTAVGLTLPLVPARQAADAALADLLDYLAAQNYAFTTPTAGTHSRGRDRGPASDRDALRDIFGWTRPFAADQLEPALLAVLRRAAVVEEQDGVFRLTVRVSTVDGRLYLHSAPTNAADAVFLGPDSYRYARFLRQTLNDVPPFAQALDIGTGAGVGALTIAGGWPGAVVTGSDINPEALRLARINAAHNRVAVTLVECSGLPAQPRQFDIVTANPPYIAGEMKRTYRDGGGPLGAGLALEWVAAAMPRLTSGGRFLLYTGSAIVRGEDLIRTELERLASGHGFGLEYDEIDPDVFGGTLRQEAYRDVERIAAVGAVLVAP